MAGFTQEELEEMARADALIDQEDWAQLPEQPDSAVSDLVWVSRLARAHRTTYGKFVTAHSPEELERLVEQERGALL